MIRTTRWIAAGLVLAIVVAGHGVKRKLADIAAAEEQAAWAALWRDPPRAWPAAARLAP